MKCIKCTAENPAENHFCGTCGAKLESSEAIAVPGDDGAFYCGRHKKAVTRVRCGRCEVPICTRCAVHGPAGVRCRSCARNRVPVRPLAVLHEAGRAIDPGRSGTGRVVWYLAIWYFVISIFTGMFGGHGDS